METKGKDQKVKKSILRYMKKKCCIQVFLLYTTLTIAGQKIYNLFGNVFDLLWEEFGFNLVKIWF